MMQSLLRVLRLFSTLFAYLLFGVFGSALALVLPLLLWHLPGTLARA